MADPKKALEILEKYYATVTPERFKEDVRRATPRGESLHEEWGWIKLEFESLPFCIGNLPSMHLSSIGALGGDEATGNNTGEMEGDVRVIQLSELFDSAILETHLPWAGPALHLVKAAGETSESDTIYIGAVDAREDRRNQRGALRVLLIAPNGKEVELHLSALRPSGIFEDEYLTDDWQQYTLKISIEDKDEFHPSALPD
jgi:hypothetical protein